MDPAKNEGSNPLIPEEDDFREKTPCAKEYAEAAKLWGNHSVKAEHKESKNPRHSISIYHFYVRHGFVAQAPDQYKSNSEQYK